MTTHQEKIRSIAYIISMMQYKINNPYSKYGFEELSEPSQEMAIQSNMVIAETMVDCMAQEVRNAMLQRGTGFTRNYVQNYLKEQGLTLPENK